MKSHLETNAIKKGARMTKAYEKKGCKFKEPLTTTLRKANHDALYVYTNAIHTFKVDQRLEYRLRTHSWQQEDCSFYPCSGNTKKFQNNKPTVFVTLRAH